EEFFEALGIQQGLGLLVEEGLVGGAAALGDEEEFVFGALGRVEVDLRGEVGAGVGLLIHVQRCGLGVAEILLGVALIDALGEPLGVVGAGPDLLALLAHDGGGAGVPAAGAAALRDDPGALAQGEGVGAMLRGGI